MKPIIVVHGIGGGDSATKSGYSNALRDAVLSGTGAAEPANLWTEAAWEGVNDQLDEHIKSIVMQLIPAAKPAQREAYPKTCCGTFQYLGKCIANVFSLSMRKNLPTLVDYLLDFPLYMGEPRGTEIRKRVKEVIKSHPHSVLVGHSLGSLICYDILCEAIRDGEPVAVDALVTLGSPIGWAKTVDDPQYITVQSFPINIPWTNMYYPSDPVCLSKPLDVDQFRGVTNIELTSSSSVGLIAHTAYWKDAIVADKIRELAEQ